MSIGKLFGIALLGLTVAMTVTYSRLMEENIVSGLLFGSEFRMNRAADARIAATAELSTLKPSSSEPVMPSDDGTPVFYARLAALPAAVQQGLPDNLVDGQFTAISIDEPGIVYDGHLLHLYRVSLEGDGFHVVQRLVLAEYERERVLKFDSVMDDRQTMGLWFVGVAILIVFLVAACVAIAVRKLLKWCDNLSIESLPEKPPSFAFVEMRRIAAGTLDTVKRERDAIDHQHRFLRFASHELRTPLSIAAANTELLARHGVFVDGEGALQRLQNSIKNMTSLTDTLLWLGRKEVQLPVPETVDLVELVEAVIEVNRELAQKNNLVVDAIQSSNSRTVQPRVLLEILCSNLISNAIRYTRNGRVEIRIGTTYIEIENRGEQLGDEVADDHGHGLGLQLVAWVVERANWQWTDKGDEQFRCHRVELIPPQS